MVKTMKDVEEVRAAAKRLEELGISRKTCDNIRKFATEEAKRLRTEARAKAAS